MRTLPALAISALLLLPACGGSSDPKAQVDAGYAALGSGSYSQAAGEFESALLGLEEGSAQWERAKRGQLQALAHADPGRAAVDLLAFAETRDLKLDVYHGVTKALIDGKHVEEAQTVLKAAWAEFPDSKPLKRLVLDALVARASTGGESGLEDLGYTSGGDPDAALEDPQFQADLAEFLGLGAVD